MKLNTLILIAILVLLYQPVAISSEKMDWGRLSPEQQKLLQPFSDKWPSLSAERQAKLMKGADRWLGMSAEQQARAKKRLQKMAKFNARAER
jgi:Protein of unknown function (DUF3106).